MSERQVVTLCDPSDAYAFTIGTRLELATTTDGRLVPKNRRQRLASRFARAWRKLTFWRGTRIVVVQCNYPRGEITMATARWSWRRWKWVTQ